MFTLHILNTPTLVTKRKNQSNTIICKEAIIDPSLLCPVSLPSYSKQRDGLLCPSSTFARCHSGLIINTHYNGRLKNLDFGKLYEGCFYVIGGFVHQCQFEM